MSDNPYSGLPPSAYWRSAVAEASRPIPEHLYRRKWPISRSDNIATAGSCFAQHIGRRLALAGFAIMDVEPPPPHLPIDQRMDYGYGIYSARYGNVYTVRQMRQLAEEALGVREPIRIAWRKGDRFVDALRPSVEPDGLPSEEVVFAHRDRHLARVRKMLREMDLLIFTMGLTETWVDRKRKTVFPTCPGTIAGVFDEKRYAFKNFTFSEIMDDFIALRRLLKGIRDSGPRFLLTVSPVPLTATASAHHVQVATIYSKSVLRAVAGEVSDKFDDVDYFPSYEIITSPWSGSCFYESNMRSIATEGVGKVMRTFMGAHGAAVVEPDRAPPRPKVVAENNAPQLEEDVNMQVVCDEELLEAFGPNSK